MVSLTNYFEMFLEGFFFKSNFEKDLKHYGIKQNFFKIDGNKLTLYDAGNVAGLKIVADKHGMKIGTNTQYGFDFIKRAKQDMSEQDKDMKEKGMQIDYIVRGYRLEKEGSNMYNVYDNDDYLFTGDILNSLQDIYTRINNKQYSNENKRLKQMEIDDKYVITSYDPDNEIQGKDVGIVAFYRNQSDDEELQKRVNDYAKKHKMKTYGFRKAKTEDEKYFLAIDTKI